MRTPLLIVGDGPSEPTGLGRIARDLCGLIKASDLPVDLVQCGGSVPPVWTGGWAHVPLDRSNDDWGASQVAEIWRSLWGDQPGVLWVIWDPSRLFAYLECPVPAEKWGYVAIDGVNVNGTIGGPARVALERFDRILAYGRWASEVLTTVRKPMPYLPHGIDLETYAASADEQAWVRSQLGPYYKPGQTVIGMVATNQPRKDLSLFFGTLAELRKRGRNVYGWLHTDHLVKAWSIPQLVEDYGLERRVTVTLEAYTDRQLAALYGACDVTLLTSLGEGFGYPIVESLASGTPVVHSDCAGGAELVPKTEWRVPMRASRVESVYALVRPVLTVEDWANATERTLDWRAQVGPEVTRAYCHGSVAHLDWSALWPRWRGWIRQGLEGR